MGSGSWLLAQITGPAKDNGKGAQGATWNLSKAPRSKSSCHPPRSRTARSASPNGRRRRCAGSFFVMITDMNHESNQANRAISTSPLNASPRLHAWPIHVVVFHGSQGSTRFKGGFPLRCLQRLSRPYIATLHCGWRHNSSTRGTSIPVLSY